MKKKLLATILVIALGLTALAGCGKKEETVKVSATSVPHTEILEFIKEDYEAKGYKLEIITIDDYPAHNRSLSEKEVDANYFQHVPYLNAQIADFGYKIKSLAKIHIEPLGLYSNEITDIKDLPQGATIAVPNDPSNESRALLLLHEKGLITVDDPTSSTLTILNIKENPNNYEFKELDAAFLPRSLPDVTAAVINTNFALQAELNPVDDALLIEGSESPYANLLAIREGDEDREELKALAEVLSSEKTKQFILDKYKGAIVPVN